MSYEVRGSLFVFLTLIITVTFSPFYRCIAFLLLIGYSMYCSDLLAEIPFYLGTLLADLSLIIGKNNLSTSPSFSLGRFRAVKEYWPITLALFALFLAGYPSDSPDNATWTHILSLFADAYFPSSRMHPQYIVLTDRTTYMGFRCRRWSNSHICNSLFSSPPSYSISSLRSVSGKHFLPYVSPSLDDNAVSTYVDSLWIPS